MRKLIFALAGILLTSSFIFAENSARVKFQVGTVQRQSAHKTSWQKTRINDRVYQGDRLKTSVGSRVELEMPDGSVIKVDQSSIFDVKEIKTAESNNEDKMSFTLWAGNIWAHFKKIVNSRQSRTIESPSAVVAIRGTTLEINVNRELTTTVSVVEGRVSVKSREAKGEVFVNSNQKTVVKKGQPPAKPTTRSAAPKTTSPTGGFSFTVNKLPIKITDASVLGRGVKISGKTIAGAQVLANGMALRVGRDGSFNGLVRVREGINKFDVIATYQGKTISRKVGVFINTKKPRIKLSTPLVSGFFNKRNYSLSGAVFDDTPQDKIKVFLNGELVGDVRGRGSFNRTIVLQEGENTIRVSARDLAGNTSEYGDHLFLDTVKPVITITEPAQRNFIRLEPPAPPIQNNKIANRFRQIIRGVIIDPEPSSKLKRLQVNGKEIRPNSDGSFETEIILKRGRNRIVVIAEDLAGNIARDASREIIVR